MFLIMSGAYIGQELESEFGKIPPSFLPLGNRRLFQHQVKSAPEGVNVFISVPESYHISTLDKQWLNAHSVTIIATADDLTLGASLVAALNISDQNIDSPLHVLFGDTLIQALPNGDDIVGISEVNHSYQWAVITNNDLNWLGNSDQKINSCSSDVVNGYFKFSQPRQLIKAITQNHWEFIGGLNSYHNAIGLTPVKISGWLDFGHVNTYYHSKAAFTTQRYFNELAVTKDWIEKSSYENKKIRAEANWFTELPPMMRSYIPQFLGVIDNEKRFSYRLEYLQHTALNELFVFSTLPAMIWIKILNKCTDFIVKCRDYNAPEKAQFNSLDELFGVKTEQRLSEYCQSQGITFDQSWTFNGNDPTTLNELMNSSKKHLPVTNIPISLLHGDFCFSNILYDFRADRVKTIDPRGLTADGQLTIYGDTRYDLAKLSHSVLGLYDWIIAGYYEVEIENDKIIFDLDGIKQHKYTQQSFIEIIESKFGLTALNLYAMQIQLFLSMLSLHSDDLLRQQALFANAFRLHEIIKRLEQ